MTHHLRSRPQPAIGGRHVLARLALGVLAATALAVLLVGVPWGLTVYVGWPLPEHLPTLDDLRAVAFAPMSPYLFLDVLACVCWLAWTAFTVDVLLCLGDAARARRTPPRARSVLRVPAATLVGLVVVALIALRDIATGPGTLVTGVAPAVHTESAPQLPASGQPAMRFVDAGGAPGQPTSVLVRSPRNGVHDSLWRIATRTLGEGRRWPEIFELNKGMRQPYGHTFWRPSLIYPGQELRLPVTADPRSPTTNPSPPDPTSAPPPAPADPSVGGDAATPEPPPGPAAAPHGSPGDVPAAGSPIVPGQPTADPVATTVPALPWFDMAIVGAALAVALAAGLATVRRRARRRYRPGSGDRLNLPAGPVVRRLQLDFLHAPDPDEAGDEAADEGDPQQADLVDGSDDSEDSGGSHTSLGDAKDVALTLAAVRGLGLVGDGAPAALRALLLTALLTPPSDTPEPSTSTRALIPIQSLHAVLGCDVDSECLPASIEAVATLDDALDVLELETLRRIERDAHHGGSPGELGEGWAPPVLVTEVPDEHSRLQTVLDNGAQVGIIGLLLGQWRPGVSAYVQPDGTVSATSPGLGENLRGARLFQLDEPDTAALLDLLHHLAPEPDDAHAADVVNLEITDTPFPTATESPPPDEPDTATETAAGPDRPDPGHTIPAGVQAPAPGSAPMTEPAPRQDDEITRSLITIRVFGPPRLLFHNRQPIGTRDTTADVPEHHAATITEDITTQLQPRTRELLVYLALHPDGATREALAAALYPSGPLSTTGNALNSTLTRLRRAITDATDGAVRDLVVAHDGLVQLDHTIVATDYAAFDDALTARRTADTDADRTQAEHLIVASYHGSLADGMTAEWIETARDSIRRTALDAAANLARTVVHTDPQRTLDLLEIARTLDPHNEPLYRDIMRVQARTGRLDAVSRTLALLTTRLAEVGETPTPDTAALAARLVRAHGPAAS